MLSKKVMDGYAVRMESGMINFFRTHDEMVVFLSKTDWNDIKECGKAKYIVSELETAEV